MGWPVAVRQDDVTPPKSGAHAGPISSRQDGSPRALGGLGHALGRGLGPQALQEDESQARGSVGLGLGRGDDALVLFGGIPRVELEEALQ